LTAAGNEGRAGPERFRVIDCSVKFDHVSAGHDFIKHCQRWWSFSITHAFAFLLLRESDFNFDFTQTFDQRLHASRSQRLD
jgi:hypothetical protein